MDTGITFRLLSRGVTWSGRVGKIPSRTSRWVECRIQSWRVPYNAGRCIPKEQARAALFLAQTELGDFLKVNVTSEDTEDGGDAPNKIMTVSLFDALRVVMCGLGTRTSKDAFTGSLPSGCFHRYRVTSRQLRLSYRGRARIYRSQSLARSQL